MAPSGVRLLRLPPAVRVTLESAAREEPLVLEGLVAHPLLVLVAGGWEALVPRGASAWTLGRTIIMRQRAYDPAGIPGLTLIAHEVVHVAQWASGRARFALRYAADYVVGRFRGLGHLDAYRAIAAEREASDIAGRLARTLARAEPGTASVS